MSIREKMYSYKRVPFIGFKSVVFLNLIKCWVDDCERPASGGDFFNRRVGNNAANNQTIGYYIHAITFLVNFPKKGYIP